MNADFNIRLERNKTENRLLNKPSKRDIQKSEELFCSLEVKHRLCSYDDEIPFHNYVKINNTNLQPNEVAMKIKELFAL